MFLGRANGIFVMTFPFLQKSWFCICLRETFTRFTFSGFPEMDVQRQEASTSASLALFQHTRTYLHITKTSVCGSKSFLDFWRFERNPSVITLGEVFSISRETVKALKATRWRRLHITLADNLGKDLASPSFFSKCDFHFGEALNIEDLLTSTDVCVCVC